MTKKEKPSLLLEEEIYDYLKDLQKKRTIQLAEEEAGGAGVPRRRRAKHARFTEFALKNQVKCEKCKTIFPRAEGVQTKWGFVCSRCNKAFEIFKEINK